MEEIRFLEKIIIGSDDESKELLSDILLEMQCVG